MIALLVQNLQRLDETIKEDSDGVHNALGAKLETQTSSSSNSICRSD